MLFLFIGHTFTRLKFILIQFFYINVRVLLLFKLTVFFVLSVIS